MTIDVRAVEKYDDAVFADLVKRNLEADRVFIPVWDYNSPGDQTYQHTGKTVRIGAFDNDRMIGLSWGRAEAKSRFVMHMSLVEPSYRKRGVYSSMLRTMLSLTSEFDEIDSYHHLLNNDIIALKLKRGFYIIGTDLCIPIGPRVHLRYFNNSKLFDLMRFRTGLIAQPVSND